MITNALNNNWHNIEQIGIAPASLAPLIHYDTGDNPITRGIHLTKHDKGKVYAFVKRFDVGNERHAQITVGTHRHGGETFTFNSYKESRDDKQGWVNYSSYPPVKSITPPQQDDNEWRLKAFNLASKAFNAATGANVSNHAYILKKGVDTAGVDIRLCGGLLQYPFYDIDGTLKGYQTIDAAGVKRPVIAKSGDMAGAFVVIGDADLIKFGFIPAEGLASGLSCYHSKKLNPNQMPVVVCLSAGNMKKVIALLIEKYGADCCHLYPDNDCGKSDKTGKFEGNTGVRVALELCHEYGIKSYRLPVSTDGLKCDFNDTEEFTDVIAPTGIDYQRALIEFAQTKSVNKLIWQY